MARMNMETGDSVQLTIKHRITMVIKWKTNNTKVGNNNRETKRVEH